MSEVIHEAVASRLRAVDGLYTGGRRMLVDVLLGAGRPLTVEEILERSHEVRQSSVYRNLAVFEREGLVHRLSGHDEFTRYELAEELVGHHHHLACRSCGSLEDVELPPAVETALATALSELARHRRFSVEEHRIDVVGRCGACSPVRRRR